MSIEPLLKLCLGCGRCTEKMDKCKVCKDEFKIKSYYCSRDCQKADWSRHKALHKAREKMGSKGASSPLEEALKECDENGMTPLMKFCYHGDWKAVQKLLNAGTDPEQDDSQGLTALNYAIAANQAKVVQILCSMAPQSLILRGPAAWKNSTCLLQAAFMGKLDVLKALIEAGGQEALFKADTDGRTCLHAACKYGHIELVRYLVQVGGKSLLFSGDLDGRTCVFAACEDDRADIIALLIQAGGIELVETRDFHKNLRNSFILLLCQCGHHKSLRVVLKALGAARVVEILTGDSSNALFESCGRSRTAVADLLLALPGASALLTRPVPATGSCLHAAADSGHVASLRSVLHLGGTELLFQPEPCLGYTCLHVAASKGRAEAAALLAKAGGERLLLLPDKTGDTCLHVAAQIGHLSAVRALLRAGGAALARAHNPRKGSPLHAASLAAQPHAVCGGGGGGGASAEAIADAIIAAGGAELLDRTDFEGSLPIHLACIFGSTGVVRAIARVGGPEALRVKNARGHTPLEVAFAAKHDDVLRTLHELGAAAASPAPDAGSSPGPVKQIFVPGAPPGALVFGSGPDGSPTILGMSAAEPPPPDRRRGAGRRGGR